MNTVKQTATRPPEEELAICQRDMAILLSMDTRYMGDAFSRLDERIERLKRELATR